MSDELRTLPNYAALRDLEAARERDARAEQLEKAKHGAEDATARVLSQDVALPEVAEWQAQGAALMDGALTAANELAKRALKDRPKSRQEQLLAVMNGEPEPAEEESSLFDLEFPEPSAEEQARMDAYLAEPDTDERPDFETDYSWEEEE